MGTPAQKKRGARVASATKKALPGALASKGHQYTPAAQGAIEAKVMKITPQMAEEWLGRNSHNRPIRNARVEELVGVIERGEWFLNGDSIRFDANGVLSDGQHRLWAIALSGITVESLVVTGLASEAQETIDVGARRNLKDVLSLRGETNASMLAAVLNVKWKLDQGLIRTTRRPSIQQALAVLDANPALRDAKGAANKIGDRFKVSSAVVGVCWYEFQSIDPDDADVFFEKLATGVALQEGEAILALRRYMETQTAGGPGAKSSALMTHALFIKAWNYYREGRHIERLMWRAAGTNAEPFPTPK